MTNTQIQQVPRVGMFATVRNRRGVVSGVEPYDGETGRLHLVHLEYKDDQLPLEEKLLWELESRKTLLEPTALPPTNGTDPMPPREFDALLRATRWIATLPYLDPDGEGPVDRLPISSPFHGAVQIEDYQLVPLLKALRMPRVNMLLADDVGLGKTIEAGLILSELLLRRRIQKVLILTPASLRLQWRDEMWEKFSLSFDLVDRQKTHNLQKSLGMDANPWRSFSHIITSYHYLRQTDVLEQFLSVCQLSEGQPKLPWDLLIVDECHNLMPSPLGEDSDLCKMLRSLAPKFEHRLFLSATPHNGHTRSFTGLLEILDPVRFSQTDSLKPAEKARIQDVVVRRLKREINARTSPPKFCGRNKPKALTLKVSSSEIELSMAFDDFRKKVKRLIVGSGTNRRRAGNFAVEVLGKRLLSCPTAFVESWKRCKEGLTSTGTAKDTEITAAEKNLRQETDDDREVQTREATATTLVGSWLKGVSEEMSPEIEAIDKAVSRLGFNLNQDNISSQTPPQDTRFEVFVSLVKKLLQSDGSWRDDERLVVFTEYKTTLDYVVRRFRELFDDERVLTLFGGMDEHERDLVKHAFNDPSNGVRILIATDAAAEGLNLQRTARYMLHYDIPWNPSKLEQRNGRLDRHGQARDVTIHHFVSDQDQDLRFLAHVIGKADEIREDLGSVNELFDEAAQSRLVDGENIETVQKELGLRIEASRGRAEIEADETVGTSEQGGVAGGDITVIANEIDLDPSSLRDTLEAAMAIRGGRPQISFNEEKGLGTIVNPGLPGWSDIIDDSLRASREKGVRGPVVQLAFSSEPFLEDHGSHKVFSPRPDAQLMHLSHPMLQKALNSLTRLRFPGTGEGVSRWTVRLSGVPKGYEALILLSVEELAVNELRESFHHWVRTITFPVHKGKLGDPLKHRPAYELRSSWEIPNKNHYEQARNLMEEIEPELVTFLKKHSEGLTTDLKNQLELDGQQARKQEKIRYQSRQGEISRMIEDTTLTKLEKEIEELKIDKKQWKLFDPLGNLEKIDRSIETKKQEVIHRKQNYEEVRKQLEKERDRIIKHLLPKRHKISGKAQVFPLGIEIRLPGGAT